MRMRVTPGSHRDEAYAIEISLQHRELAGRDHRTDVAVGRTRIQSPAATPMLLRELHGTMVDLVAFMNRRSVIERFGPLGVGDLADRAGRDYMTVSRQVAKLVELGLVDWRPAAHDRPSE